MRKDSSLSALISNRYWRVADAERVLAALEQSGLSASAFAREYGTNEKRLLRWRRRVAAQAAPRFHPVKVVRAEAAVADSAIELVLAGGERLVLRQGFDPRLLRQVLDALEGRWC